MSFSRSSAISVGSGFAYRSEEIRFDDISDEELRQILQLTVNTTQMLSVENDLFERYLTRNDPQTLKTIAQRLESSRGQHKVGVHFAPKTSPVSLSRSSLSLRERTSSSIGSAYSAGGRRSTSPQIYIRPRIGLPHRMQMAKEEIEYMRTKLAEFKQFAERRKLSLTAKMEEFELRIREIEETRAELDENVVRKGVDPTTGKIPAEKFVRFVDDRLKRTEDLVGKLRLKSSSTKMQIKKAKTQLKHRLELGEALHVIDFHELSIENEECAKKIEEKNSHLLELKKIAGTYGLKLNNYKQKLHELVTDLSNLQREIGAKIRQIEKLQSDRVRTEEEVQRTEEQLTSLLNLMEEYEVPNIVDFIKLRDELRELEKTHKQLLRRKNIQRITYKSFRPSMKKNVDRQHRNLTNSVKADSKKKFYAG